MKKNILPILIILAVLSLIITTACQQKPQTAACLEGGTEDIPCTCPQGFTVAADGTQCEKQSSGCNCCQCGQCNQPQSKPVQRQTGPR